MRLEGDALLEAVRTGSLRRPPLEELAGLEYFVDRDGRVYSLNGEQPKVVSAKTGWGGLEWVTLMTRDGWKRFCVGELVAETFMPEGRPGSREEWAVVHLDGNPRNNAVSNLRWATRLEANQLRQDTPTPRTPSAVTTVVAARSGPAAEAGCRAPDISMAATTDSPSQREMLALIERNQRTQHRLDALSVRFQRLLEALTPFAQLARAPELRLGHPDTTVLEANRGRPNYCKLTVADFRRAEELMRNLEGRREG